MSPLSVSRAEFAKRWAWTFGKKPAKPFPAVHVDKVLEFFQAGVDEWLWGKLPTPKVRLPHA